MREPNASCDRILPIIFLGIKHLTIVEDEYGPRECDDILTSPPIVTRGKCVLSAGTKLARLPCQRGSLHSGMSIEVGHKYGRTYFVLLYSSVSNKSDIVVDIKIKQGTGFPSSLVHDKVVERVMLERNVNA